MLEENSNFLVVLSYLARQFLVGEKGTTPDFPGLGLATFSGTPFAGRIPWRN